MVGKQGRVTGKIATGLVGEVMIQVRGGVEAFYAYPTVSEDSFELGQIVVVTEYHPPRTVYVAAAYG